MFASKFTSSVFLLICFLSCSVSEEPPIHLMTAKHGDDVTLPCKAPNNVNLAVVEWTRSDLESYVYLKIDGHLVTADQDPSYVNRVQLKDDEMKNGELSLILNNVNSNDGGTYECRYEKEGGGAVQFKLISIVILNAEDKTVKSGDDVTLHCQSPRDGAITSLQWIRPDLKTDEYVFFFRDNRTYEHYQHPSFRGRVQLMDPQMKNGEVSVILKNVNINDTGTYECRVTVSSAKPELMNIINLKLKGSGQTSEDNQTGGNLGLIVGLPVGILLLLVGFVIYIIRNGRPFQRVLRREAVPQQDCKLSDL